MSGTSSNRDFFLKRISQIAPREQINSVFSDISSFYTESVFSSPISGKLVNMNCQVSELNNAPSVADEVQMNKLISKPKQFLEYLFSSPDICCAVVTSRLDALMQMYTKKLYFDFLNLSFFANSFDLFHFITFLSEKVKPGMFNSDPFAPSRANLQERLKQRRFLIDPKLLIKSFDHHLNGGLNSPVSFAASENFFFVALNSGDVHFLPTSVIIPPFSIKMAEVAKEKVSLCYASNNLFLFASKKVFIIDVETGKYTKCNVQNDFPKYPVVTDGMYFYSISRSLEVKLFLYEHLQIVHYKTIQLKLPEKISSETPLIFATDGTVLTLLENSNKCTFFYGFSLVTGQYLWKETFDATKNYSSWTIIPLSRRIAAINDSSIYLYQNLNDVPRWVVGHMLPVYTKDSSIIDMFNILLFHGIDIFPISSSDTATILCNSFLKDDNAPGVYSMLHIMKRGSHSDSLAKLYDTVKNSKMRTYIMFTYLFTIRNSPNMRTTTKENIASQFILDGYGIDLILIFHELFDFKRIPLTPLAANQLLGTIIEKNSLYPLQANFIIESFLINYATKEILNGNPENVYIQLQNLSQCIQKELLRFASLGRLSDFLSTIYYSIWKRMLRMVYTAKAVWSRCGNVYAKIFDISLDSISEIIENEEIQRMLNRTYFLQLELIFSVPYKRTLPVKMDDLFNKYPHQLNGMNPDLDNKIFQIISNSYDLDSIDALNDTFHKVRNFVLFNNKFNQDNLDALLQIKQYGATDIIPFLKNGNKNVLPKGTDESILYWFINRCGCYLHKQTMDQFIIFSIFAHQIKERQITMMSSDNEKLSRFVHWLKYPFILPADLVRISRFEITTNLVSSSPVELIENCFDDFAICCQSIRDKTNFFSLIIPVFKQFISKKNVLSALPNGDPSLLYKSILKFHLAIASGYEPQHSDLIYCYKSFICSGNYLTVTTVLKAMTVAFKKCPVGLEQFFEFLFDIIGRIIQEKEDIFVWQNSNLEKTATLFAIIHFLRSIFNDKSDFLRRYLQSLKEISTIMCVGIFAFLNDSIDFIRKDLHLSFYDEDHVFIEGNITSVDFSSGVFEVNSKGYNINHISSLIPKVSETPNIELIDNFSVYTALFENNVIVDPSAIVFREASLAFFSKSPQFVSHLSKSFVSNIISDANASNYVPGNTFLDFIYYLSRSHEILPSFSFLSKPIPRINIRDQKCPIEKTLMALNTPISLTSTPIHHRCASTLIISPFKSLSDCIGYITINALSSNTGEKFVSPRIPINPSSDLIIKVMPEDQSIYVSQSNFKYILSPSTSLIFYTLELNSYEKIKFQFDTDQKYQKPQTISPLFQFNNCEDKLLDVSHKEITFPFADSCIYIETKLQESASILSNSLRAISCIFISSTLDQFISPGFLLDLLLAVNPYPLEEIVVPSCITHCPLFAHAENVFYDFVMKKVTKYNVHYLFVEIANRLEKNQLFITTENTAALFIPQQEKIWLSDCVVISPSSERPVKYLEFTPNFYVFSSTSMAIPCHDIGCSIMAFPVHIRHALMLAHHCEFTDISNLIQPLNLFISKNSFATTFFAQVIDLINALYPTIPPEGVIPTILPETYFFPHSMIYSNIDNCAIFDIIDCIFNPIQITQEPTELNFFSSDKNLFAAIPKSKKESAQKESANVLFIIRRGDNAYQLEMNHYLFLESGQITVSSNSDYNNVNFYAIPFSNVLHSVIESMKHWTIEDSHLLRAAFETKFDIEPVVYSSLSLSNKFDFNTAKAIYSILERKPQTQLATFFLHKPKCSINLSYSSELSNLDEVGVQLLKTKESQDICDYSRVTQSRAEYLKVRHCSSLSYSNSSFLRFEALPPQSSTIVSSNPEMLFNSLPKDKVATFLKTYISNAPIISILEFALFCTGEMSVVDCKINCASSIKPGIFISVPSERLLIVGLFDSFNEFLHALKEAIYDSKHIKS